MTVIEILQIYIKTRNIKCNTQAFSLQPVCIICKYQYKNLLYINNIIINIKFLVNIME